VQAPAKSIRQKAESRRQADKTNSKFKIQDSKGRARETKFEIQDSKGKTQKAEGKTARL
jgi:hypothetical protein